MGNTQINLPVWESPLLYWDKLQCWSPMLQNLNVKILLYLPQSTAGPRVYHWSKWLDLAINLLLLAEPVQPRAIMSILRTLTNLFVEIANVPIISIYVRNVSTSPQLGNYWQPTKSWCQKDKDDILQFTSHYRRNYKLCGPRVPEHARGRLHQRAWGKYSANRQVRVLRWLLSDGLLQWCCQSWLALGGTSLKFIQDELEETQPRSKWPATTGSHLIWPESAITWKM